MSACECSPCGRKFSGLSTFDRHQDVDYSRRPAVQCLDPATLGMTQNRHGSWGFPQNAPGHRTGRQIPAEQLSARGSA